METKQIHSVPRTYKERYRLRNTVGSLADSLVMTPPLSMDNLYTLAGQLIADHGLEPTMRGWLMVEINNRVWRDTVAAIPHDRRILFLPKCLSNSQRCTADVDELGLLCRRCGDCSIPDLQEKADALGMMSIVAEGFTSVIGLVENRVVDAVIGVSCLDSLEKAFPLLIDNAVPGVAVPLNCDGCKDTDVDISYVIHLMTMISGKKVFMPDYDRLRSTVRGWFTTESLAATLGPAADHTSVVARQWLSTGGKRWRPYMLASICQALTASEEISHEVRVAAIAVECFHKASLVHDDIQDNDTTRYGRPTINAEHGAPIAINVGDMLLGEGYRLIAQCGNIELVRVAAEAHTALCRGQGLELEWSRHPRAITMEQVLNIFHNKTVPAFHVALVMGLICAGGNDNLRTALHNYSHALGIAYQLLDDIEDFDNDEYIALRPSAILAALCELNPEDGFIRTLLTSNDLKALLQLPENRQWLEKAIAQVRQMAEKYSNETLEALNEIKNTELKRLLFRIAAKVLKKSGSQ